MDINDAQRANVGLEDLITSADLSGPILGSELGPRVEAGIAALTQLVSDTTCSQNEAEGIKHIVAFQSDEVRMRNAAVAFHFRSADVQAKLSACRAGPTGKMGYGKVLTGLERSISAEARKVAEQLSKKEGDYRTIVLDGLCRELGVTGLRCPQGWSVTRDGVTDPTGVQITRAPIVIAGAMRDVDTDSVRLEIAWQEPAGWRRMHCDRLTLLDHRKIVTLAAFGAPINSVNASLVVKYIEAFEAQNQFKSEASVSHMGWIGDETFVHGDRCIGKPIRTVVAPTDRKIVSGYRQEGTWEGWCETISKYAPRRPVLLIAIAASAASVLLHPLNRPGFIVDMSGETSRGKTMSERAAASAWGCPDDTGDGIILKWSSPGVTSFLHSAWLMQSMPLLLDDTKQGKPEVIKEIMFDHPSGQDRLRGTADGGIRPMRRWRSVLISTGEAPITSFSGDGGARARCLLIRGAPFGEESDANRRDADLFRLGLMANYGHLGPRLVELLLRGKERWGDLRARYLKIVEGYAAEATSAIGFRLVEHVAVVHLATEILSKMGVPGDFEEAMKVLASHVKDSEPESDLPRAAMDSLYGWASANEGKFYRPPGKFAEPHGGWVGRWNGDDGWDRIGFRPELVVDLLRGWGYDANSVITAWKQRQWLELGADGRNPNYGKNSSRLLVVKRAALERE